MTLTAIQQEFQQDVAWFQSQVEVAVRTPVVFIDPIPVCQPMPVPFLESAAMDLGDGFTLAPNCGQWELRREGIFIARFGNGAKAINAAVELRFYCSLGSDAMDFVLEFINETIERWGGVTL